MVDTFIERQLESAMQDMFDDKAARIMKYVNKLAAKQGGASTIENYRLLGKRVLIGVGVVVAVVQVTTSVVGFVMSRRSEEQRMERVVRRVLEEERERERKDKRED